MAAMDVVVTSSLIFLIVCHISNISLVFADYQQQVIQSFHVKSDIRYRFATTQIESVIKNVAGKAHEVIFDVTLPKEAFIVKFSMSIDGKDYDGEVKEKTAAKKQYIDAVDLGQSAGLVRQVPRHSNMFEVSANVANGSDAKFFLTYQELLRRKHGVYTHEVHVNPGQKVNDFRIEVFIQENKPLRLLKTPAMRSGSIITNEVQSDSRLTKVDHHSSESAYVTYQSSLSDQINTPSTFVVEYDVEHSLQGDVMVVDGYFVHFFSTDLPPMPKDIVFVLDVSGSMYGNKIQQLKDAMQIILSDLQPTDRFSVITFSSDVHQWESKLVSATEQKITEAKEFIKLIISAGGTNINSALLTGISVLQGREDTQRVGMIFFLTDGIPTVGVDKSQQIVENVYSNNKNISSIFGLAFGSEADYELLKIICGQNSGFARKIYEDSDAALQVSTLYDEIAAVSMKDISINYLPSSVDEYTITEKKFPVIFNGSEVIVCGKLADNANVFQMEIKGLQNSGSLDLVLNVTDVNNLVIVDKEDNNKFFKVPRDFSGLVEKMWAFVTVKQLLKEKEIHASNVIKVEELKTKILQIALKYKFVTPLTSMVVTKPESPDKPVESGLDDAYDRVQKPVPLLAYQMMNNKGSYQHFGSPGTNRHFAKFLSDPLRGRYAYKRIHGPSFPSQRYTQPATMFPTDITPKKTKNRVSSGFHVSTIIAKTSDLSICMAPGSIEVGKYNLITSPNGNELKIETNCSDVRCKNFFIKSLILKSKEKSTEFTVSKNGDWEYKAFPFFTFNKTNSNTVIISVEDFEVTMTWVTKMKTKVYNLSFEVKNKQGYKGLIGMILNSSPNQVNKWRQSKVPLNCKDKFTDISKTLKNKMVAKYKI